MFDRYRLLSPPQPRPGPPKPLPPPGPAWAPCLCQQAQPVACEGGGCPVAPTCTPARGCGDVSPHGWGTGLLRHVHGCQESWGTACMFMEPARGLWRAVLSGGVGFSGLPWTGDSHDTPRARPKHRFAGDCLFMRSGPSAYLSTVPLTPSGCLLVCGGVRTHVYMCP